MPVVVAEVVLAEAALVGVAVLEVASAVVSEEEDLAEEVLAGAGKCELIWKGHHGFEALTLRQFEPHGSSKITFRSP